MKRNKSRIQAMLLVAIMFVGLTGISTTLQAQSVKPVTVQSSKGFNGTISALKKAVSGGGMMVLAEINQGKILEMTGLKINAHSFFIGNPNMGKKAFSADPAVGVVIPVRVNLYEKGGKTYINYFKPSDLLAGTVGLEIIREIGFRLGGMPGDMPKLLGVLITNRFAYGPNFWSNVAGWSYHFWNGAAFGIVFSLLVGRGRKGLGIAYGILVGIGFMASPVPRALGIGSFGGEFKNGYQFALTVTLAHIAFGAVAGWVISRRNKGMPDILTRMRQSFVCPVRNRKG